MRVRGRVYLALNPQQGLTLASKILILLILAATGLALIETEATVIAGRETLFAFADAAFASLFALEYALRIWSAPECGRSRLRYALSPWSLIDLLVVVTLLLPLLGVDLVILRLLRAMRMVSLAKVGRYSSAFDSMRRAVVSRSSHLLVSLSFAALFLMLSATIMYWIEGERQPEQFGSIPRALWWGAPTMTTVGYGDVVPQTALGRLLAGFVSLGGIVLIAIPTGIMAAAFSDELRREPDDQA